MAPVRVRSRGWSLYFAPASGRHGGCLPEPRQRLIGIGVSAVKSMAMTSCAEAARAGGVERIDSCCVSGVCGGDRPCWLVSIVTSPRAY